MLEFRTLTLADADKFRAKLTAENIAWEYNFATVYLWNVNDSMQIAEADGAVFLYNKVYCRDIFMPPYIGADGDFLPAAELVKAYCNRNDIRYFFRGLSKEHAAMLDDGKHLIGSSRNDYDYVYSSDDLKYLKGKSYHSKRNFVNRFKETYDYEFADYTADDHDLVMELFDSWLSTADESSSIRMERAAVLRALKLHSELDLKIGLLKVKGKCVGFSVSSIESNGIVHTIFEKGDINYVGVYQALNQMSAERYFPDGALVNRQEDMGIEGLRKAKLSYFPRLLVEKYFAEEKQID